MTESEVFQNRKGTMMWAVFQTAHTFTGLGYVKTGLVIDVVEGVLSWYTAWPE